MATSAWFNYNGYMNNKLAQLQKADSAAGWDMAKLVKTFADNGFVGDTGAETHFVQYGQLEDVAPNAFFNSVEYFRAKAAQLYGKADPKTVTDLEVANVQLAIKNAGMSAWSHYTQYGNAEQVNPSNSFDTAAYMNTKLGAINAVPGGKQYTLVELNEAFKAAGLSALEHFMIYAGKGGLGEVTQGLTVDGKVPADFAVPENKKVNVGGSSDGKTINLTADVDNLAGTPGNDIFMAGTEGGATTLNAGDQLNGGAGIDTLKLYTVGTPFPNVSLTSIEIVEDYIGDTALNVSGNADIEQLWLNKASTNAGTAAKTQVIGFGDAAGNAAAVATFTDNGGTADAATIAVKDAGKTTAYTSIAVAGIETLTINASGTNNLGTLTAANAGKVIITGSGNLKTTLSDNAAYKTIDASTATGNIVISAAGAAVSNQVLDIKTGTGNDEYTTLFANLTKADKIDLGAGTDTLTFADATSLVTTADGAKMAGVAGVEVIKVTGSAAFAVNGDVVSQSLFNHSSTGAFTGTNFASTDKLTIGAVDIASSTVGMKLGETTFNLDLAGLLGAVSNASDITVTGASTVNVNSAGALGAGSNILNLTTDGNGTVNVTGSHNLTLTADSSTTTGLSIKADTFTGNLTVDGSDYADSIIGGIGADRINGGLLGDTLKGGDGVDTFVYDGTVAAVFTGSLAVAGAYDHITDFVAGTDKIVLANTGTPVTSVVLTKVTVATAADVTALLAAIDAQVAATVGGASQVGLITVADGAMAGTYVFVNDLVNAAAATDTLIDVTGVTGTITAADFAFA